MRFPQSLRLLRPPSSSLIALLTDFGREDHYAGTMKGVIASINPEARVIDISHEVRPQQIVEGAFLLWSSYRFFPSGTIFAAVVDPGVGGTRKIIVGTNGVHTFVAPENGILDFVLEETALKESVEVEVHGSSFVLTDRPSTFQGRDVFAPVAAYLACGVKLSELGSPYEPRRYGFQLVSSAGEESFARIVHIDHFGNIVTNVRTAFASTAVNGLGVGGKRILKWTTAYEDAPPRIPCLIGGSSGMVEIMVKNGNAAKLLRVDLDSKLRILSR